MGYLTLNWGTMGTQQMAKWMKSDTCSGANYDMKELVVELWRYFHSWEITQASNGKQGCEYCE
jgi:hypothetical protein